MFVDTPHLSPASQRKGLRNPRRIGTMLALWRSRRALAALTSDQLADVGLTQHEAQAEARRPFWDAPEGLWDAPGHWRR